MLRSVSQTHVLTRVRMNQSRKAHAPDAQFHQDSLVTTTVSSVIELINAMGFVVAKDVDDPDDAQVRKVYMTFLGQGLENNEFELRIEALKQLWPELHEALGDLAEHVTNRE